MVIILNTYREQKSYFYLINVFGIIFAGLPLNSIAPLRFRFVGLKNLNHRHISVGTKYVGILRRIRQSLLRSLDTYIELEGGHSEHVL